MSKQSRKKIIREEEIDTNQDILDIKINEEYLENILNNTNVTHEFMCKLGIFSNTMRCIKCQSDSYMSIVKRKKIR